MTSLMESMEGRQLFSAHVIGTFDAISGTGQVSGWALDAADPGRSTAVLVYVDGKAVATVPAGSPRGDVNAALAVPGDHGFTYQLSGAALDGRRHTVRVYGTDAAGGHKKALAGATKAFTNARPVGVDDATSDDGVVSGWAFDPSDPAASIGVQVLVDGTLIGGAAADAARDDVNAVYGIGGRHGFAFALPAAYLDGARHTVQVRAVDPQGGPSVALDGTGRVFSTGPDDAAETRAAKGATYAKGVQAVLLEKWSDASVQNLIDVLTAKDAPDRVELSFVEAYGGNGYKNSTRVINALLRVGKSVDVTTHFTFKGSSVSRHTQKMAADSGTYDLAGGAKKYDVFVTKYARYIANGRVKMALSPSLEDNYEKETFDLAATVIFGNLGDSAGMITLRHSSIRSLKHSDDLHLTNKAGVVFTPAVEYEKHGVTGNAFSDKNDPDHTVPFAAYSNDGNVVYYDQDAVGLASRGVTVGANGHDDEGERSAKNAGEGPPDATADDLKKYPLKEFTDSLRGYRGTVLLWRPAYNLYDKLAASAGAGFDISYKDKASQGPAGGRNDRGNHFDYLEQVVLARFLGVRVKDVVSGRPLATSLPNVVAAAVKPGATAFTLFTDTNKDGKFSSKDVPLAPGTVLEDLNGNGTADADERVWTVGLKGKVTFGKEAIDLTKLRLLG